MNQTIRIILLAVVIALVGAGSFYLGKKQAAPESIEKKAPSEQKILYYRNPMGLPDTSPVPKKDGMGMDYVAVYAGEESSSGTVAITPDKLQMLGVRIEAVQRRKLTRSVRATGLVEIDERKQQWISPRFEGWVQQLNVNTTGQTVKRGQPLLTIYSPELESAAREAQLAHDSGLVEMEASARNRLDNWQIAPEDLAHLEHGMAHLVLRSPIDGVVIEKLAVAGSRFAPGDILFKLADLSSLWLQVDVSEQDQGALHLGQVAEIKIDAYAQETFSGKVSFIAPVINDKTRTVRVRLELPNKDSRLRPGMYANVTISDVMKPALTIPLSAVIDSGTRQVALVQVAEGRFQPRSVQLGTRNEQFVVVLGGLNDGESVVTSANFLIDAESNLKAALSGLGNLPTETVHSDEVKKETISPAKNKMHKQAAKQQFKSEAEGYQAQGTLNAINADGTVNISHEPIKSLSWPGMTMNFALSNANLADGIQAGSTINFELFERKQGEWVIRKMQAASHLHNEGN